MNDIISKNRSESEAKIYSLFDILNWMTTKDAATYLRMSEGAIRIAVSRGELKSYKFRRRLYFKKADLDKLIEGPENKGA